MLARTYVGNNETMAQAALRYLREVLTEARTDGWADAVAGKVPAKLGPVPIPRVIVRAVLDSLLPDKLLWLLEFGLKRLGLLPSDRQLNPENPFRA